ncbi:unnamed protein product [Pieris macdunnoughi]|uniref:Gag-like protein n=1 Tax=Pieris macdunnoughi TaxID=345717 RepID=A0A821XWK4_9NEOP|nr:unnamed protein product [Pieris macdunnoughi]
MLRGENQHFRGTNMASDVVVFLAAVRWKAGGTGNYCGLNPTHGDAMAKPHRTLGETHEKEKEERGVEYGHVKENATDESEMSNRITPVPLKECRVVLVRTPLPSSSPNKSIVDREVEAITDIETNIGRQMMEASLETTSCEMLSADASYASINSPHDKDKRDDQPSKVTNQAVAKKTERKETAKEGELDERIEKLETISKSFEKISKESEERVMVKLGEIRSYAEVAAVARTEPRVDSGRTASNDQRETGLYSLIVEPGEETEAAEDTVQKIRCSLNARDNGFKIEKLQKIKGGKVVIGCGTEEERTRVRERITYGDNGITARELNNKNPLVRFKNILRYNTLEDIKKALKTQNKATTGNLTGEDWVMTEKHRQNARNTHECHVIVKVSPGMWKALTRAQKVHIDLQMVWVEDRSPLVQCATCLGYGHTRKHCQGGKLTCSQCTGEHLRADCPSKDKSPECANCKRAGMDSVDHSTFSTECPVRRKWDALARRSVAYC